MTGPSVPTNEEIVASLRDLELEGAEEQGVTQQVTDFIAAQKTAFDQTIADMQSQLNAANAAAMPADTRASLNDSLKTLKSVFDGTQRALTAAITPPA